MWEDHKESWALKNWCFWTEVLEKTLESPVDYMEIKPVNPKGNQSWIFIVRTDVKAETPILWPHDVKNWLIGKDPDAGKDWRQEEKGKTENEMVRWYHRLNGHEFGKTPGVGDGLGSLECCSPWGHNQSDTTEWTELIQFSWVFNTLWTWSFLFGKQGLCVTVLWHLRVTREMVCLMLRSWWWPVGRGLLRFREQNQKLMKW